MSRNLSLAAGLAGLVAWLALAVVSPDAGFRGWAIAFLFWSGPALGSLTLALIRRLTAGRWGDQFAPEMEPAARTAPLLIPLAVPLAFGLPSVFGWAATPGPVDPSVRAIWLNAPSFLSRDLAFLVGWSLISLRLSAIERQGDGGRLGAGLGLAFHALAVSLIAVDWINSTTAQFVNSAAGMTLATQQLMGALAWCALQTQDRPSRGAADDVGGLLFATALGLTYLVFMAWLIGWYGDRPGPNSWWLPRARAPWGWVSGAATAVGLVGVAVALLLRRWIGTRTALRAAGAAAAVGLFLYILWLYAPPWGVSVLPAALAALVGQGGLWTAAARPGGLRLFPAARKAAHA